MIANGAARGVRAPRAADLTEDFRAPGVVAMCGHSPGHDQGMTIDADALTQWFDRYLDTFAACARGDRDITALLDYYAVPLIITTDAGVVAITTHEQAAAVLQGLVGGLQGAAYHHSEVLAAEASVLNTTSGLYRATLSRRDRHGREIDCVTVSYVVTDGPHGPQISVLAADAA